jgi:hypothetical protein
MIAPKSKCERTDVTALIPKDPRAPLTSQQTYREVFDEESRCCPASCIDQIETMRDDTRPVKHCVNRDC